ncbi:MAG: Dabb family protein, partial [Planctomycetota bacterium]
MIEHVVLFAVTPETDSEKVDEMVAAVRELPSRIPGIVSVSIGQNFNNRGKNYTHGLVVRLESSEALDTYLEHPAHVEV